MGTQKFNSDIDVNGEVKGTSLDVNGNADISGNLTGVDSITASATVQAEHLYSTDDLVVTDDASVGGDLTVDGTTYGIYHSLVEDGYYHDDYNGSRNLSIFYKNARADLIRYQAVDNYEYWNGSAWVADASQEANVEKLLDGRQDTSWYVPERDYKFRFTTNTTTGWPTQAMIWMQQSWTGSTYPGCTVLVEETADATADPVVWVTKVTAEFTSGNGSTNWGLHARADGALHTGNGNVANETRITVDFYGWSPSNASYDTIPLQNLMITSNFSGTENTDYTNLFSHDTHLRLGDDRKFIAGTGSDLQIYHDGSNSYISEVGTGDLIISADNDLTFKDGSGNIMANMNASNSVELMFGNSKKFETVTGGVLVTGELEATTLDINGAADISGALVVHNQITGTEIEGTSLDINGAADISGNLTVHGKITQSGVIDREEWGRTYSIAGSSSPQTLLTSGGGTLPDGGGYRVTGHISGTGTDNVAVAVFWNENGTWYVNNTYFGGSTSNHVNFLISGGVPKVSTMSHGSTYSVHVTHEHLSLEEGTGTDNLRGYFGTDSYLSYQENGDTLTLNGSLDVNGNADISGNITSATWAGGIIPEAKLQNQSGTNTGDQTTITGNAGTATKLAATKTIAGVAFDGSTNISLNNNAITNGAGYTTYAGPSDADEGTKGIIQIASVEEAVAGSNEAKAVTAAGVSAHVVSRKVHELTAPTTALAMNAQKITGVADPAAAQDAATKAYTDAKTWNWNDITAGTAPTFNQNTTGSAATLTTPRAINGVDFNGSAAITIPTKAYFEFKGYGTSDGTNYEMGESMSDTNAPLEHNTSTGSNGLTAQTIQTIMRSGGTVMPRAGVLKKFIGWVTSAGSGSVDVGVFKVTPTDDTAGNLTPILLVNEQTTASGNSIPNSFSEDSSFDAGFSAGDIIYSAVKGGTASKAWYFSSTLEVEWS